MNSFSHRQNRFDEQVVEAMSVMNTEYDPWEPILWCQFIDQLIQFAENNGLDWSVLKGTH